MTSYLIMSSGTSGRHNNSLTVEQSPNRLYLSYREFTRRLKHLI